MSLRSPSLSRRQLFQAALAAAGAGLVTHVAGAADPLTNTRPAVTLPRAKKLTERMGGVEKARRALDVLAKIV